MKLTEDGYRVWRVKEYEKIMGFTVDDIKGVNVLDIVKDQLVSIKPGDARSLFSLDYLSDMIKAAGKANEVTIELGRDFPTKINFRIANGSGDVSYLLAPRIESD